MGTVFAGDDAVLRADGRNRRYGTPDYGKVGYFSSLKLRNRISFCCRFELGSEGRAWSRGEISRQVRGDFELLSWGYIREELLLFALLLDMTRVTRPEFAKKINYKPTAKVLQHVQSTILVNWGSFGIFNLMDPVICRM